MKRYRFEIILASGNEIHARTVGKNRQEAEIYLNEALRRSIIGADEIISIKYVGEDTSEPESAISIQNVLGSDMYIIYDKNGFAATFEKGQFNDTVEILPPPGAENMEALDIAKTLRQFGDWLAENAPELI